ncbi:hypothetical protein HOD19_04565 [bacterium]|jgi:hypothetical protein|nr:hypothetical protein [bacterium]MBT4649017.1 hypothetical protein [bacterium]
MKYNSIKFILLVVLIFLPLSSLQAADLFFDRAKTAMPVSQQFMLPLYLDTGGEAINALEGEIIFPVNLLEVKEIRYHDSFINFWIEEPSEQNGKIKFSGIVPGGYMGRKSLVLSIIFEAQQLGNGQINFNNTRLLLNDGTGKAANLYKQNWNFEINNSEPIILNEVKEIIDRDPPEIFDPILTQAIDIANEQFILIFATQDKGSGISHYEVKEGKADWVKVTSPYILQNQNLDDKIIVKAVDKNGNQRLVIIKPINAKPWYAKIEFFGIIILVILLVAVAYLLGKKTRKHKRKK